MNAYKSVFRAEISDHIAMRSSIYSERTMRATVSVLLEFDGYLCDIGLYEKKLNEPIVENWIQGLSGKSHTVAGDYFASICIPAALMHIFRPHTKPVTSMFHICFQMKNTSRFFALLTILTSRLTKQIRGYKLNFQLFCVYCTPVVCGLEKSFPSRYKTLLSMAGF